MAVRKDTKNGKWLAEVYVNGKRSRKWFLTKGDALRFYNQAKEGAESSVDSVTVLESSDLPVLSFYVQEWFDVHGKTLSDGEARLAKLKNLCANLGDPPVNTFNAEIFADYRKRRLDGEFSANKNKLCRIKSPLRIQNQRKVALYLSAKNYSTYCRKSVADYLMMRTHPLKMPLPGQKLNCRKGNLPTFCAIRSPAIL